MQVHMVVEGTGVAEELSARGATIGQRARDTVRAFGAEAHQRVVSAASGAPGPEVVTGEYIGSIEWDYVSDGDGGIVRVWSDADYSDRLEYGFSGTDSLGRMVFAAPYPHFRPAFEQLQPEFEAAMERIADF